MHRTLPVAALAVCLVGCAAQPQASRSADAAAEHAIRFVVFGDSGYHLDYPRPKDVRSPIRTREEWVAHYRKSAAASGADVTDAELPLIALSRKTGGFLPASGMMPVATAMTRHCDANPCRFALMLGDNIYPRGADGIDDALRFQEILMDPFGGLGASGADFAIYATLGNHDWKTSREGARSQVEFMQSHPPFYMDGFFYKVSPPGNGDQVELFVIDTHILLGGTTVYEAVLDEHGRALPNEAEIEQEEWARPQTEAERNMVAWLDDSLRRSTATWKIVIGHHPLWSAVGGKYAQSTALRALILRSLCNYADAYFAGHEHTLELHQDDCRTVDGTRLEAPLPQIVSGAAAKQRDVNERFLADQADTHPQLETFFARGSGWGFSYVTLAGDSMTVDMIGVDPDASSKTVYSHVFHRRSTGR